MIDMVEVIRCRDCKHFRMMDLGILGTPTMAYCCHKLDLEFGVGPFPDDYCCWAERRDDE